MGQSANSVVDVTTAAMLPCLRQYETMSRALDPREHYFPKKYIHTCGVLGRWVASIEPTQGWLCWYVLCCDQSTHLRRCMRHLSCLLPWSPKHPSPTMHAPSQGVVGAMVFSGIPFLSKKQREREQAVHLLRDAVIDAKDEARSSRLSRSKSQQ